MSFQGCLVRVSTISQIELEGRIDTVDSERHDISLVDISARKHGKITHIPRMTLNSKEIAELKIMSPQAQEGVKEKVDQEAAQEEEVQDDQEKGHREEFQDPAIISYQKQHRPPLRPHRSKKNNNTVDGGWAHVNAAEIHQTDFDFEANLQKFDKSGIFAEFNKNPPPKHTPKQKPSPRRQQHPLELQSVVFYAGSKRVPSATALQMVEAERVASEEYGLSFDMVAIHAGRSIAEMCMKILDDHPYFSTSNSSSSFPPPPRVLLLGGNHRSGAYTLSAALNLLHRGILVFIVMATHHPLPFLQTYLEHVHRENAEILHDLDRVPQVDLVLDALLGISGFKDISHADDRALVCDLMELTRATDVPILSIDVPSGLDATTGLIPFFGHVVVPKWTLCLGIPKAGLMDPSSTGALYLTDVGFPNHVWTHIGIEDWSSPFSNQFIVPLTFPDSFVPSHT